MKRAACSPCCSSSPTKRARTPPKVPAPSMSLFQYVESEARKFTSQINWSTCENPIVALDEITSQQSKECGAGTETKAEYGWSCAKCTFHNPCDSSSWCSSCCSSRMNNASKWSQLTCNLIQQQQIYREAVEQALPSMVDDLCDLVAQYLTIYMQSGHRVDVSISSQYYDPSTRDFTTTYHWRTARITARLDGILAHHQLVIQRQHMIQQGQYDIPEISCASQDIDQMACVLVVIDGSSTSPPSDPTAADTPTPTSGEWISINKQIEDDIPFHHDSDTESDHDSSDDITSCVAITSYSDDTRIYPSERLAPYGSHTFAYYDKLKMEAIQARVMILTDMGFSRHDSIRALRAVGEGVVIGHNSGIGCDSVCVRNAVAYLTGT